MRSGKSERLIALVIGSGVFLIVSTIYLTTSPEDSIGNQANQIHGKTQVKDSVNSPVLTTKAIPLPKEPISLPSTYRYSWNNTDGLEFHPNKTSLQAIGFPLTNFVQLSKGVLEDYVFATAANSHYVKPALDGIATVQTHFPHKKILFYDIGITEESVRKVKSLCNVEYREFPFDKMPSHVKNKLKNYSWKFLIIHMVLQEYQGVYWIDSSIRFKNNQTEPVYAKALETGGISFLINTNHANFPVMMPEMAKYLVTDANKQKTTIQAGATVMLIYRTKEVYNNILKWATLCSLEQDCINHGQIYCSFHGSDKWAHCSRFDQTAVNVLSSNHFGFNQSLYRADIDKNFDTWRGSHGKFSPKFCQ